MADGGSVGAQMKVGPVTSFGCTRNVSVVVTFSLMHSNQDLRTSAGNTQAPGSVISALLVRPRELLPVLPSSSEPSRGRLCFLCFFSPLKLSFIDFWRREIISHVTSMRRRTVKSGSPFRS